MIALGASLFAAAKNVSVVVALFYLSPFIAILAAVFGATHAFLLHALPKRGPLNSILLGVSLGGLLGFSAALREFATLAGWALLGALHGAVIGLRERRVAAARSR